MNAAFDLWFINNTSTVDPVLRNHKSFYVLMRKAYEAGEAGPWPTAEQDDAREDAYYQLRHDSAGDKN